MAQDCTDKKPEQPDLRDRLELCLHEQFAQNYNNTFGATITLFCTLLATLYGYGYVFLNSSLEFSQWFDSFKEECGALYRCDALVFVTIAAVIVLTIMMNLCLYLGINQRKEQFIIFAIRTKMYGKLPTEVDNPRIFPKGYHPFKQKEKDYPVGIYGELLPVLHYLIGVVSVLSLVRIVAALVRNCCCCVGWIELILLLAVIACCFFRCYCKREDAIKAVKQRKEEFKEIEPK